MNYQNDVVLQAEGLTKAFQQGENQIIAVDHMSFTIRQGEFVAITGPSGSGKTTLLNIIGCILKPDSGSLWLRETEAVKASDEVRAELRRTKLGYVFQDFKLLPALTAEENIVLPLRLNKRKLVRSELGAIAHSLGIERCLKQFPTQLSGGTEAAGSHCAGAALPPRYHFGRRAYR